MRYDRGHEEKDRGKRYIQIKPNRRSNRIRLRCNRSLINYSHTHTRNDKKKKTIFYFFFFLGVLLSLSIYFLTKIKKNTLVPETPPNSVIVERCRFTTNIRY